MPYAIEMFFDKQSEKEISDIWKKLAEHDLPARMDWRPHISLSVYDDVDLGAAEKSLMGFCAKNKKFPLALVTIGFFPTVENVLFATPLVTEELLRMHRSFHDEFKSQRAGVWQYYLPGNWQPHCTMAIKIPEDKMAHAFLMLKKYFKPMTAAVESIGIVEFEPTKVLKEFSLA